MTLTAPHQVTGVSNTCCVLPPTCRSLLLTTAMAGFLSEFLTAAAPACFPLELLEIQAGSLEQRALSEDDLATPIHARGQWNCT